MAKRLGLLLINLGTPASPEPMDVGRYLRKFLMDRYIIDIPWLWRWILVNLIIVPKRRYESARLYKSIWTDQGSPLFVHLRNLGEEVQKRAGSRFEVEIAMRYGEPSIQEALEKLNGKGLDEILVFPLYPQYSESTTLTSREACLKVAKEIGLRSQLRFLGSFPTHKDFVSPLAKKVRKAWDDIRPEHVLMSFHGLPEKQILRADLSGGKHCLQNNDCCERVNEFNQNCYRAQCFATARALAAESGLDQSQYSVSFQSRFGRARWIQPYTEDRIREIAKSGVKRLAVVCPGFIADCLESNEEIGVRGREIFLASGGKEFHLISCLNSDPEWAEGVIAIAEEAVRFTS